MFIEILRDRRSGRNRNFKEVDMGKAKGIQTIDREIRCRVGNLKKNKGIKC